MPDGKIQESGDRNWAGDSSFLSSPPLVFLLKKKATEEISSPPRFTAFYPLTAEPDLTRRLYSDAVGKCENLLLGFYFLILLRLIT